VEQKVYFEGSRRLSDKNFLIIPAEEPNAYLGGHWYLMTPKPCLFLTRGAATCGPAVWRRGSGLGHVYHLGSTDDVWRWSTRRKASFGRRIRVPKAPKGILKHKDKDFFLSDRFIGASWESLPLDLSEKRLCEVRCFGTGDDMSNWASKPKYLIAEGDTYTKRPDDETYPQLAVNYLKLDKVPLYNESWAPIVEGIRAGNFFGTTGEVLFHTGTSKDPAQKRLTMQPLNISFLSNSQS
jgi:hypothetical protein